MSSGQKQTIKAKHVAFVVAFWTLAALVLAGMLILVNSFKL